MKATRSGNTTLSFSLFKCSTFIKREASAICLRNDTKIPSWHHSAGTWFRRRTEERKRQYLQHRCDFRLPKRPAEARGNCLPDIDYAVGVGKRERMNPWWRIQKNEEDTKITTAEVSAPEFAIPRGREAGLGVLLEVGSGSPVVEKGFRAPASQQNQSRPNNWRISLEPPFPKIWMWPHTIHQNSLKRIKDLNVRTNAIKLLEDNVSVNLCDLGLGNGFLDMTTKAQATKENHR